MAKLVKCKTCGAPNYATSNFCYNCGRNIENRAVLTRWWFWLLMLVAIANLISCVYSADTELNTAEEQTTETTEVAIEEHEE